MNSITLHTDGSCNPSNPGPGGIGYIVRYTQMKDNVPEVTESVHSQGYKLSTNNRMELLAAIQGMAGIISNIENKTYENVTKLNVCADSTYLTDAINQKWLDSWRQKNWQTSQNTAVKNKDLWEQIIQILEKLRSINVGYTFTHVAGHQGDEFNERCDKLASEAAKSDNRIEDTVYESQYKQRGEKN